MISSVNTAGPQASGGLTSASSAGGFGSLSSGEFIEIITTELANQDPLQPNDTTALLEQLSSLRSIESQMEMTDRLGSLVSQNEVSSAAGLIGREVLGLDDRGGEVRGTVDRVAVRSGKPTLILDDGSEVAFSSVREVAAAPAREASASGTTEGSR